MWVPLSFCRRHTNHNESSRLDGIGRDPVSCAAAVERAHLDVKGVQAAAVHPVIARAAIDHVVPMYDRRRSMT